MGLYTQSYANLNNLLLTQINESKVTLKLDNVSIKSILYEVQKQTKINFIYTDSELSSIARKSVNVKNATVVEVLNTIFAGTNFTYQVKGNSIAIVKKTSVAKNNNVKIELKGKVIDEQKNPIVGATIIVAGTTKGALTDDKGQFAFSANVGDVLDISYVGMVEKKYIVKANDSNITIEMEGDAMAVDDVVVTGYFNRKKDSYTGNATTYTGKELTQMSSSNVMTSLSMIDPSFKMITNNEMGSNPNVIPDFQIQGPTNLKDDYNSSPNMPTFILDGYEVSPQKIFDLDPNTVKSITLLKDAAASAIYGSRAANGVVVVETIPPEPGKLKVTYNFYGDLELADLSSYNLMNSEEKLQYEVLSQRFKGISVLDQLEKDRIYNEKLAIVRSGVNTDWIKKPVKDVGISHKHTIIVQGGDKTLRYTVNANYRGQSGVMKESGRDNYGIGVKLQYSNKKLMISNDLTINNTNAYNSPYGSFGSYTRINPYLNPYDENGNLIKMMAYNTSNPLYNATIPYKDETGILDFSEKFTAEWSAFRGFKLRLRANLDRSITEKDDFKSRNHTSFDKALIKGSYASTITKHNSYNINLMASYVLSVGKNVLNATLIYDMNEKNIDRKGHTAYDFPNDNFDHISMAMQYKDGARPIGSEDISRDLGLACNLNYSYDNRYLADASVRSDASSVFGSDNRWGTFYSVGIGWNIHNESFLKDIKAVDLLKIRVSQGTTGGVNFDPYQAMMSYNYKPETIYLGELGALLMGYGNSKLKWQETEKLNFGLDFGFFNNRLTGNINRYQNVTKNKLINLTLAPSTGFPNYMENMGEVENTGWELSLKGGIIRNTKNSFRWDLFFNLVSNKNRLLNTGNALDVYNNSLNYASRNGPVSKYVEGQSLTMIWVNQSLGIDPVTGNEVFINSKGERSIMYNANDNIAYAEKESEFEGTFGTSLSYKGFSVNAFFAYSVGGHIYNQTLMDKVENVDPAYNADRRVLNDRWQKVGDNAKFKSIENTTKTNASSRFVEEENFVRLSSLNVSYDFQSAKLKKAGIAQLRVGAVTNDLFRISTVKMERGTAYPFARKISFSAQITF